jgi:hypothetical protein
MITAHVPAKRMRAPLAKPAEADTDTSGAASHPAAPGIPCLAWEPGGTSCLRATVAALKTPQTEPEATPSSPRGKQNGLPARWQFILAASPGPWALALAAQGQSSIGLSAPCASASLRVTPPSDRMLSLRNTCWAYQCTPFSGSVAALNSAVMAPAA